MALKFFILIWKVQKAVLKHLIDFHLCTPALQQTAPTHLFFLAQSCIHSIALSKREGK